MEKYISAEEIKRRVSELGKEIAAYYNGDDLTVICVMNGSMTFCADLIREMDIPLYLDSIAVSSYEHFESSGRLNFRCEAKISVKNRHILLVDDIFDTGFTMSKVTEHFMKSGALSVECCCLLNKKDVVKKAPCPKWIGFDIPEVFVIGYGLDADEQYRNLPDICIIEA